MNANNNELALRQGVEADPDEPEDELAERMAAISKLQSDIFKRESENEVLDALNNKLREGLAPLAERIAAIQAEIADDNRGLAERREERVRKTALFFRSEREVQAELLLDLGRCQHALDQEAAALGKLQAVHRAACDKEDFIARVVAAEMSVIERDALKVPLGTRRFAQQDCLHALKPRVSAPAALLVRRIGESRLASSTCTLKSLAQVKLLYDAEEQSMEEFPKQIPSLEKAVTLFQDLLLGQRRQKAMQKELVLRKMRLSALRDVRIRAMREVKEQEEEKIKNADEERELARRNYVPLRKRIAKVTLTLTLA